MSISRSNTSYSETLFDTAHLKSELKKRALRGAGATIFSHVAVYGIQMLGTIILARILSPDDFGLVAMVTAFSLIFQNFGVRGFTEATIQSEEISHKKISTLFWIHFVASLTLTLIFMAFSPLIAWFYNEPRLQLIAVAISVNFIFSALSTQHLALLRRNMQFYRVTANEITAAIISVTIALALAWQGYGYWSLVAKRIALIFATAAGAWILCRWLPGLPALGTGVRSMLKFGINTYGNFTLNYFSRNIDKILIGWRHGSQSLALYERAYYLFVMPVNQLSYPLTSVAVAALSRLRDEPEKYRRYYLKAVSNLAFIGMPLSAILTLIGKDFIILLLGPQWSKAGEIFSFFGPGIGILLIYGTHGWLHLSLGRADRWFRWSILEVTIITLSFILGLPFGALGVAIAYSVSFYVLMCPGLWYAGIPINLKIVSVVAAIWKYYACAFAAGLFVWYILYSVDVISSIFGELGIFARILLPSILCLSIYALFVIVVYRSLEPISQFTSLIVGSMPKVTAKK